MPDQIPAPPLGSCSDGAVILVGRVCVGGVWGPPVNIVAEELCGSSRAAAVKPAGGCGPAAGCKPCPITAAVERGWPPTDVFDLIAKLKG